MTAMVALADGGIRTLIAAQRAALASPLPAAAR